MERLFHFHVHLRITMIVAWTMNGTFFNWSRTINIIRNCPKPRRFYIEKSNIQWIPTAGPVCRIFTMPIWLHKFVCFIWWISVQRLCLNSCWNWIIEGNNLKQYNWHLCRWHLYRKQACFHACLCVFDNFFFLHSNKLWI